MTSKPIEEMTDAEYADEMDRALANIGYCSKCGGGPLPLEQVHIHTNGETVWHSECCDADVSEREEA